MTFLPIGLLLAPVVLAFGLLAPEAADPARPAKNPMSGSEGRAIPGDLRKLDGMDARQRKAFKKYGSLGVVTQGMDPSERIVLCHTIAQGYASIAAEDPDRNRRMSRFSEIWRFEQRLAEPLQKAREALGEEGYDRAQATSNQAMGLLSMMPDPKLKEDFQQGQVQSDEELMYAWVAGLASRCGQMLDEMGIDPVSGEPPAEYLEAMSGFRYRGAASAEVFADTGLAPYANAMCRDGAAPDFAGAQLEQRGKDGMSLLDWAIECNDRSSFDALIAAGFDLDTKGLWEDPPLVRAASEKRLWFLTRLLDQGVNPDTMGRTKSALVKANDDLDAMNFGGDTRAAFNVLRERGATLDFPSFQDSMWYRWSLHETRWDLILAHWDEFGSDPVELADVLEFYLSGKMNWAKKEHEGAALRVKDLLIEQYGVCFPVGDALKMEKDERGFRIQPDCPKGD